MSRRPRLGWQVAGMLVASQAWWSCAQVGPPMQVSTLHLVVDAGQADPVPSVPLLVSLDGEPEQTLRIVVEHGTRGLAGFGYGERTTRTAQVLLNFKDPRQLGAGVYQDTVTIKVCADLGCREQVPNSPATVQVTYSVDGTLPVITGLEPAAVGLGAQPPLTLTVVGEHFSSRTRVLGRITTARPTTLVSPTRLTTQLLAEDLAFAGPYGVVVSDAEQSLSIARSNSVPFFVVGPAVVTGSNASSVAVGAPPFALALRGWNLGPSTTLLWNGVPRPATWTPALDVWWEVLTVEVTAADLAVPGQVSLVVSTGVSPAQPPAQYAFTISPR